MQDPDLQRPRQALSAEALARLSDADLDVTDTEKTLERRPVVRRDAAATQEVRAEDVLEILDPRTEATVLLPRVAEARAAAPNALLWALVAGAATAVVAMSFVVAHFAR